MTVFLLFCKSMPISIVCRIIYYSQICPLCQELYLLFNATTARPFQCSLSEPWCVCGVFATNRVSSATAMPFSPHHFASRQTPDTCFRLVSPLSRIPSIPLILCCPHRFALAVDHTGQAPCASHWRRETGSLSSGSYRPARRQTRLVFLLTQRLSAPHSLRLQLIFLEGTQ